MAVLNVKETVELGERFEISPGQRLQAYDCGMAEAFAATDRVDSAHKIFALISPGHLANRGLAIAPTRSATGSYLMWPVASGIVDWPVGIDNGTVLWGRRPAFIYAMPSGERLIGPDGRLPQMSETILIKSFIQPAIQLLRDLIVIDCPHRAMARSEDLRHMHADHLAFDDNGNIGKRYRRQDEIGTPFCITVDFDTLGETKELEGTVTVRDRDSGEQKRVKIGDLKEAIK